MKLLKGFVLVSAIGLISFALLEFSLWLFLPIGTSDYAIEVTQDLPGIESKIKFTSNRWGFRSLSMKDRKKSADTIRILCLGASTTEQPIQSTDKIWATLLENKLQAQAIQEKWPFQIEVAAYGKGGTTVFNRLAWVRAHLADYQPDIVVTLEGVNDLTWLGGEGYRYAKEERVAQVQAEVENLLKEQRSVKNLISRYSQTARYLQRIRYKRYLERELAEGRVLLWHGDNIKTQRKELQNRTFVESPTRESDPIAEFRDFSQLLLESYKGMNVQTVVLGQPVLWKSQMSEEETKSLWFPVQTNKGPVRASGKWLATEMARYNDIQKQIATSLGMAYVPLDSMIPKDLKHFVDDCHFTDLGNEAVAAAALPAVTEAIEKVRKSRFNHSS